MAIAAATIIAYPYPKGTDNTQRCTIIRGTIAISTGGTYPPGGFPINSQWGGLEAAKSIPGTGPGGLVAPFEVQIQSSANPPSGYVYIWDSVLGNLHIFESANGASNSSGPLLEIGGAINNAIVTDSIQFESWFVRE